MANAIRASTLINETIYWLSLGPFKKKGFRWANSVHQMVLIGFEAIPIVSLICLAVGIIMALQAAYQLRRIKDHEILNTPPLTPEAHTGYTPPHQKDLS